MSIGSRSGAEAGERAPARVLWLTKGLGLGGTEQLVRMCAARLDRDRFAVDVAYVLPHKDALVGPIRASGLQVTCLGDGRAGGWTVDLARLLRSGRYDLVHTHSPVAAVATRLLVRSTPIVHTEHNMWERFRGVTRYANAMTFHRNAFVFAVSAGVADSIHRLWYVPVVERPAVEVLHHGIDEAAVCHGPVARAAARAKLGLGPHELLIGAVANFTPKKDHATLLRGFERVQRRYGNARLVLIGSGPLQQDLERLADSLGIAPRVVFTGSRADVPELLPALDIFTLTSLHEGLPIALLEAMAAGVPSVVTPVGGMSEMITDGLEGRFVPCRDPGRLAAVLDELLADGDVRAGMGRTALESVKRFSIARAVERMEVVYDDLLQTRPARASV